MNRAKCVAIVKARAGHDCEARTLIEHVRCDGPLCVHELVQVSLGGSRTDPDNCRAVCHVHHMWIHEHITDSVSLDLLRWSWHGAEEQSA